MAPPKSRPAKKTGKKTAKELRGEHEPQSIIPVDLQQLLLNVFKNSFVERLGADFKPLLQEVKGHLYNRDFLTAFGRNDYLEVYAARWSPSRALGYLDIFASLNDLNLSTPSVNQQEDRREIVCIGGGAGAEIVALGGYLAYLQRTNQMPSPQPQMNIKSIDIADWAIVGDKLHQHLTTAPPISQYASASAKASNVPLLDSDLLNVSFKHADVLNLDASTLRPLFQGVKLVTIMFTLNELYSTSLALTQKFLLNLTECLDEGAQLLVVDSPGSYSTVTLNGAEKKYPMKWLLDHTLLKQGPKGEEPPWTKVIEDESRWFRLQTELNYPIELENMRSQLHLYSRST
ncbi:hypothetical protein BU24DRAFT_280610 [Aaosphaeria arxii CBS 175.79]|uniref:25S rRNA (Uridine(2843)-N(3))-methyltransferase n=1 Tax=Aaosphaeria arxii CBS 175.79 TaxID=1450172 RepID=A0A6A5XEC9_9PLEO|nr:uncharacterized protein BU24DRAFT_280610 [Aaosphaeria arxii CBS 175.79]KAF2011412.1 hypothetical protein BU24DRAFT_280610 [Aaosphaeria arxii CBS 175.79]